MDAEIAGVAEANGFHTIVADVCAVDPSTLPRPNILHASPVCKNASIAKSDRGEAQEDIDTARAVCRFISVLRPDVFTLENVWGYRNFKAFNEILDCLKREGYKIGWWHLNSANYGVPQARKRLILVARSNGQPRRPDQTHCKNPTPMWGLKKWVGWYEAIEDLIPTLPESHFAEWQMKRLPNYIDSQEFAYDNFNCGSSHVRLPSEPASVVDAMSLVKHPRPAFITRPTKYNPATVRGAGYYFNEIPAPTVLVRHSAQRAFIVNPTNGDGLTLREDDEPVHVVTSGEERKPTRAFIVGGANTSKEQAAPGIGVSERDEPTRTVAGNSLSWRAMLVDSAGYDGKVMMRQDDEPANPIVANYAVRKLNAFMVESKNSNQQFGDGLRQSDEPAATVCVDSRPSHQPHAFLVDDQNSGNTNGDGERGLTIRDGDEPSHTVSATQTKRSVRAWLEQGRVVAMTPRCLARFQSFPDDYVLPDSNRLACTVIGNAVPPLLYQRVIEANLDSMDSSSSSEEIPNFPVLGV